MSRQATLHRLRRTLSSRLQNGQTSLLGGQPALLSADREIDSKNLATSAGPHNASGRVESTCRSLEQPSIGLCHSSSSSSHALSPLQWARSFSMLAQSAISDSLSQATPDSSTDESSAPDPSLSPAENQGTGEAEASASIDGATAGSLTQESVTTTPSTPSAAPSLRPEKLTYKMSGMISRGSFREARRTFEAWCAANEARAAPLPAYNFYLQALARLDERLSKLEEVVDEMEAKGVRPTTLTFNAMLQGAVQARDSHYAERVVRRMNEIGVPSCAPDATSYSFLVSSLANDRRVAAALIHLREMLTRGLLPSRSAINELLTACAKLRRTKDAMAILEEGESLGIHPYPGILGELITAAAEAEDPELGAMTLNSAVEQRMAVDLGSLLLTANVAARRGHTQLMEKVWCMVDAGPDAPAPPSFHLARIHSFAEAKQFPKAFAAVQALEEAWGKKARELEAASARGAPAAAPPLAASAAPADSPLDAAVEPAAAAAKPKPTSSHASRILSLLPHLEDPDLLDLLNPYTSLNPLTQALCVGGAEALDCAYFALEGMHTASSKEHAPGMAAPLSVSLACVNTIIAACGRLRDSDRAQQTFDEIERTFGLQPDVHTYSAMIHAYGRARQFRKAQEYFRLLSSSPTLSPSSFSYSFLVEAYNYSRMPRAALDTLQDMIDAGHVPSRELLVSALRRCQLSQEEEGAKKVLGLVAKMGHRTLRAPELRRRGELTEMFGRRQQHRAEDDGDH